MSVTESTSIQQPVNAAITTAGFEFGEVQGGGGGHYAVLCSRGLVMAKKAASCLIKPAVGNKVMVVIKGQEHYILSVLERENVELEIEAEGGMTFRAKQGNLSLLASDSIHSLCGGEHQMTAANMNQITGHYQLAANQIDTKAVNYQLNGQKAVVSVADVSLLCDRMTQKVDQLYRWVTTIETSHIGNLMQSVKNSLCIRSKNSVITAKGDMKIDAERIHMG
ncbi:MAG: DUF3540 domain-containing protein [Gammaproteobacteria bacterium]|nr:DUF3540 domain-containing protein [Gammaproteobacteria bacterium]